MPLTRRELLRTSGLLAAAGGSALAAEPKAPPAAASAAGMNPPPPHLLADLADYERAAPARMSEVAWQYFSGGAADEHTLRWNHEAYARLRLRPRALTDVSRIDPRVTLFGREHAFPILLAPCAYHKLAHPEGEVATARGAAAARATLVVSTTATTTLEDVAAASAHPKWFQLYVQPDRDFTRELVRRAEAANYETLVVTVDTPVLGPRHRETRTPFALPPGVERANLRGLVAATGGHRPTEETIYSAMLDPRLTWKEIAWLRTLTRRPLLLKGILTADDAARAIDHGADGVIVSNHGGRNLDTLPATIDALPEVAARVGGRVPILIDGGVRRGTDVLKAIALGASAVQIGRPYLHGLAVGGADGVARVIGLLRRELEMAMALTGRRTIAEIGRSVLWTAPPS